MRLLSMALLSCLFACSAASPGANEPVGAGTGGGEELAPVTSPEAEGAAGPAWDDARDPNLAPADVAAVPAYARRTDSGLASHVLRTGSGAAHPTATDTVTVNYAGWTTDGELFDSSWQRGEPISFPLDRVIRGWTEGVQLMVQGEIRRFWIPSELAYGENPRGGAPAGMLVFDVELISIGPP